MFEGRRMQNKMTKCGYV